MAAATLAVAAAVLITFSFFNGIESQFLCESITCPGDSTIAVRFPFRLKNLTDSLCGFQPDFDLFCNNRRQTILNLRNVGDVEVLFIDYRSQRLHINDPDQCFPKRLLIDSFDLQNSPFSSFYRSQPYTVFNCSDSVESLPFNRVRKIECMSGGNYSVITVPNRDLEIVNKFLPSRCEVIGRRKLAVRSDMAIEEGMVLKWSDPDCRDCERRGGDCGFKSNSSSAGIACFNLPKSGLSRGAKYGLIIGVAIPGLLFLIGLGSYICGKFKAFFRPNNPTSLSLSMGHQPTSTKAGLDNPTIESFPKTILGQSRRLPKPTDTTCTICLSEYQSKETIRTIPDCNHFFHANCIDEWLKLNATCPVCRYSPEDSSFDSSRSVSISVSISSESVASLPH